MLPTVSSSQMSGSELPLKLQVGFLDLREREVNNPSGTWPERRTSKATTPCEMPASLPSQRRWFSTGSRSTTLAFCPTNLSKSFCFGQLTLQARRADLQRIAVPRYDVFHIQNSSYLLRNKLAIGVGDAMRPIRRGLAGSRPVDENAQEPPPASAQQLQPRQFRFLPARPLARRFPRSLRRSLPWQLQASDFLI